MVTREEKKHEMAVEIMTKGGVKPSNLSLAVNSSWDPPDQRAS